MSFPKKKKKKTFLDAWLVKEGGKEKQDDSSSSFSEPDANSQTVESEHNITSPNSSVTDTESYEETEDVNQTQCIPSHCESNLLTSLDSVQGSRFTKLKRKDTSGVTRQFVSCDVCVKHQDVVKLYVRNGILPAIAQQQGTRFRRDTLTNHLAQAYHKQAISAERRKSLENTEKPTQMEVCISNANKELGLKMCKLAIMIYGDAKKLTVSQHSSPARVAISEMAQQFSLDKSSEFNMDFQYLLHREYMEILELIVESYKPVLLKLLENALALSLRCDGSVDRTAIDKIYNLVKLKTESGEERLVFWGVKNHQKEEQLVF